MSHYLMPPGQIDDAAVKRLSSARVPILGSPTLRDFVLGSEAEETAVFVVPDDVMMLIVRYKTQLLKELPTVLANVPGVSYSPSWMVFGSQLPMTDWMTIETTFRKAGAVALSVGDNVTPRLGTFEDDSADRGVSLEGAE